MPCQRPTRLLLLLLPLLAGCATQVAAPAEVDRRQVYQRIANTLPQASFGWGERPGVVDMAASTKAEGPLPELPRLKATERGFMVVVDVYRPRQIWIPYSAIESCWTEWQAFPNAVLVPLILVPFQINTAKIVIDVASVEGFLGNLERDIKRLEQISREIGLGGPWSHAQNVKAKLADDAAVYGAGKLALHVSYATPWFPWWPVGGAARETAEAFAWAAANPDAPELEPEPSAGPPEGVEDGAPAPAEER